MTHRRRPGTKRSLLQLSVLLLFFLLIRFASSFLDVTFMIGQWSLEFSWVGMLVALLLGGYYLVQSTWGSDLRNDLLLVLGAFLVGLTPAQYAVQLLVLDAVLIGWMMHVTGRYW